MNILISRILTYLNGTLVNDVYYQFCLYVVNNYTIFEEKTMAIICQETNLKESDIRTFCELLGFTSFTAFQQVLLQDRVLRTDQIHARMLGMNSEELLSQLPVDINMDFVKKICDIFYHADRIVLVGPLYPMSLAVEFQTDFITFGKPVVQFHHFDEDMKASDEDVIIYITATGRSLRDMEEIRDQLGAEHSNALLITQNPMFKNGNTMGIENVIHIPGRFDGMQFYHQLILLFDIIRIQYYQQFYRV